MKIANLTRTKQASSNLYLSDRTFGCSYNPTLVHQTLVSFHSNPRRCCSTQKTRSSVEHSTRKLFKQKGLGRARAGMSSTPLRRGGGRAYPITGNESFESKINKRVHKKALRCVMSHLTGMGYLAVINSLLPAVARLKTNNQKMLLRSKRPSVLFVVDAAELTGGLHLATRNCPNVSLVTIEEINPRLLLSNRRIILTERSALKAQELLQ